MTLPQKRLFLLQKVLVGHGGGTNDEHDNINVLPHGFNHFDTVCLNSCLCCALCAVSSVFFLVLLVVCVTCVFCSKIAMRVLDVELGGETGEEKMRDPPINYKFYPHAHKPWRTDSRTELRPISFL